jgi:hypothetical protein
MIGMAKVEGSNFRFIVPVWGHEYTKLFADVCLPLLLTENNLRYFAKDPTAVFVISTTYADAEFLRQTCSFRALEACISVRIILIDGLVDLGNVHRAMSDAYAMAMRQDDVVPGTTNFVFLTPDSFWSDGSFRRLHELAQGPYKVVMVLGLRTETERARPVLAEALSRCPDNPVITNERLTALALQALHPMGRAHNWLCNQFLNSWPSQIYWKLSDELMVAHCFHLHPLLVRSPRHRVRIGTTIDGDFLYKLGHSFRSYYIVQDANEMIGIELSPARKNWGSPLSPPYIGRVKWFALRNANPMHWRFLDYRITYATRPGLIIPLEVESMIANILREVRSLKRASLLFHVLFTRNPLGRGVVVGLKRLRQYVKLALRAVRRMLRG